ncbi:MAG: FAD-dependent monooxygenase [Cyanobacteriota bacterium]|jgi:2-octaprenyl-6-methoxyphenol hydroxylase
MRSSLQARVNGAGPTGALAALALVDAGWGVTVHDPMSRDQLLARSRAYAFTYSSRRLLQRLDLWKPLEPVMVPFRRLELQDQALDRSISFAASDLGAEPAGAVGWIALHTPLMEVLLERMAERPEVSLWLGAPPAPGEEAPDLVIAADGPGSPSRRALGIGQWSWPYRQACLTAQVELRGAAPDQAWELLRPEGPFAVLPLGGRRFQVVWSAPAARCRQLEELSPVAFLDTLAGALPDELQPEALLDQPRAFPVALQLATRLQRRSHLLVGESGHRCHPVGGQGLNLCWRDVEVLHRLAHRARAGKLAVARIGGAYGRRRWFDLLATLLVTDLLVRLFSNRNPLLLLLRRGSLALLAAVPFARRQVLGLMTHGPCGRRGAAPE